MKLSAISRSLVTVALLAVAALPAEAWTRRIEAGGEGTSVVDANGAVVGRLLNDWVLVRKMSGGAYVRLIFDEYGFVPSTRQLVFVYPTSDCSGTPYLQQHGVPAIGMAVVDSFQAPPYRGAAEIYYPGPVALRTIGSYARPLGTPPEGCVSLERPSKILAGTVEKQDLHFSPPFTLK